MSRRPTVITFDGCPIKVVEYPMFWVRAKDILLVMGYSLIDRSSIKSALRKVDGNYRQNLNSIDGVDLSQTSYMEGKEVYINKAGLTQVVCLSKKINSQQKKRLAAFFNFEICVLDNKAQETLIPIKQVLGKMFEEVVLEYKVPGSKYRIDLYVPAIRLAIECDEYNHAAYEKELDTAREAFVKSTLGCRFYRYNPHSKDFNIFGTIGDIMASVYDSNN